MGLTVFPKQAAGPASTNASRIQGALIDLGPCIGLCIATWPTWRAGVLLIGQCSLPPPEFIPAQEIPRQKFIQQLAVEMLLNQSTVADSSFAGPEAAGKQVFSPIAILYSCSVPQSFHFLSPPLLLGLPNTWCGHASALARVTLREVHSLWSRHSVCCTSKNFSDDRCVR